MSVLATAGLRAARDEVRVALATIADRVGRVGALPATRRGDELRAIVAALDGALGPHLEWEERAIHPIVDKFACEGPAAFSATMRYEHTIIHRWSDDLARLAADPAADAFAFARRADNLLGVLLAHFELEEEILFPILDRTLTPEALGARLQLAAPFAPRGPHDA